MSDHQLLLQNVSPFRGRRLALLGTSLMQHNDVATATKLSYHSRGWIRWAQVLSNGLFTCPIWLDTTVYSGWEPSGTPGATRGFRGLNAGVSGQTHTQILARMSYLASLACDIVVLDIGTNDVGTDSAEVIQAAREFAADYFLSLGKIVILLPILARGTASWASASVSRKRANHINSLTRTFCASRRHCLFFDWNAPWVDMTQVTDTIPISTYTDDAIHMIPAGGYAIGKLFAAFLATILPAAQPAVWGQDDIYDATDNPRGNLLTNAFLTGTTGTHGTSSSGASGVATSMRSERNSGGSAVVASKETRSDGRGFNQVLTFTPGGAAVDVFYFRTSTANTAHGGAAGDWVSASCKVDVSAYAGWRGITLLCQDQGTGGVSAYGMEPYTAFGTPTVNWAAEAWNGLIQTPPIQLVAGSTDLRWRLEIRFDAAVAGTPVLKVSEVAMRKVANPLTVLGAAN